MAVGCSNSDDGLDEPYIKTLLVCSSSCISDSFFLLFILLKEHCALMLTNTMHTSHPGPPGAVSRAAVIRAAVSRQPSSRQPSSRARSGPGSATSRKT